MFPVVVGTYLLTEALGITQHYETAAWSTVIRAEPGAYPVVAFGPKVDSVYLQFSGPVIQDFTPALFGGVPISGKVDTSRVGTIMEVRQVTGAASKGVLNPLITWNDRVRVEPGRPFGILVQGAAERDLLFPVESVEAIRYNPGQPTEFYDVVVKADAHNPNGYGWRDCNGQRVYSGSTRFHLPDAFTAQRSRANAEAIVAAVDKAGTICPAFWKQQF